MKPFGFILHLQEIQIHTGPFSYHHLAWGPPETPLRTTDGPRTTGLDPLIYAFSLEMLLVLGCLIRVIMNWNASKCNIFSAMHAAMKHPR